MERPLAITSAFRISPRTRNHTRPVCSEGFRSASLPICSDGPGVEASLPCAQSNGLCHATSKAPAHLGREVIAPRLRSGALTGPGDRLTPVAPGSLKHATGDASTLPTDDEAPIHAWLGSTQPHEGFPLALRVRPRADARRIGLAGPVSLRSPISSGVRGSCGRGDLLPRTFGRVRRRLEDHPRFVARLPGRLDRAGSRQGTQVRAP
jgi:hypothetical protein